MVHTIEMRGYNNDRLDVLQTSLLFRSCHHHRLGTRTKYGKCERSYRYDAVRTKISRWIKMRINSIDSWTGSLLDGRTDRKLVTGSFFFHEYLTKLPVEREKSTDFSLHLKSSSLLLKIE